MIHYKYGQQQLSDKTVYHYCQECGWNVKSETGYGIKFNEQQCSYKCGGCKVYGLSYVGLTSCEHEIFSALGDIDIRDKISMIRDLINEQ